MKTIMFIVIALLCSTTCVQAQNQGQWEFNGYISSLGFNSAQARQEGIDDTALGLGTTADYLTDRWLTSLGFELMLYDDKNTFSQTVEIVGGFDDGDIRNKDSDADGVLLFAAFGPHWRFGQNQSSLFSIQGGFSTVVSSERSIANCSNCFDEDIDIEGGAFVQTIIAHSWNSISLGFHFSQYLNGDEGLENSIQISLGTAF